MAIRVAHSSGKLLVGLSTDVKPTGPNHIGLRFYETDTAATYVYTGAAWIDAAGFPND